jgi:hypothetical protein
MPRCLTIGAFIGTKTTHAMPSSRAAQAHPSPWLPALAATMPFARCASVSVASVL